MCPLSPVSPLAAFVFACALWARAGAAAEPARAEPAKAEPAKAEPVKTEVFTLLDNSQIAGRLTHYYDGVLVIETSAGQKVELLREKVRLISFKLPPPRAEFSSPERVFDRWRQAVQKGEGARAVECYALMYQGMFQQQYVQNPESMKQNQKDMEGTRFEYKGATYQSQGAARYAILKVRRIKGENIQTDEVRFIQENGEWKLAP